MHTFVPLPNSTVPYAVENLLAQPLVFRGLAALWPAVTDWSFAALAALAPDLPVSLVTGNRELEQTAFTQSTLGTYLGALGGDSSGLGPCLYLKEFNLLQQFPHLQADVRPNDIFPPDTLRSCNTWIGPANARTGLHYDLLDNLAVQLLGYKRFYLVRPGVVERLGAVSHKYDQWARLATASVEALRQQHLNSGDFSGDFWVVDLHPGDVLFVPARWWHEVVNISHSMLLSGFFANKHRMHRMWLYAQFRQGLHHMGLLGRKHCTCHPACA